MSTTSLLAGVAGEYFVAAELSRPSTCIRSSRCCWKGAIVTAIEQVFQRVTKGGAT